MAQVGAFYKNNEVVGFEPKNHDSIVQNRKDRLLNAYQLINLDTGATVLNARFYMPGTVAYCCVWFDHNEVHARAGARSQGYGFDKSSAAFQEAIERAGFRFKHDIGGRGEAYIVGAFEAVAAHLGLKRYIVNTAHA